MSASHRIRAVLRVRDFRRLWLVMSFSSFGDWLGLLATTALAAELANGYAAANFALGGVLVVRLLPAVIFGPLAGAFADRFDRRKLMVVADLVPVRAVPVHPAGRRAVVAVRRDIPDRVREPVLDPGEGSLGPQPGPQGPAGVGEPGQPRHDVRDHARSPPRSCSPCSRC